MTTKQLNYIINAVSCTHPWSKSPEGRAFWTTLHTRLYLFYHENITEETVDEGRIYHIIKTKETSIQPETENPDYLPVYAWRYPRDWLADTIKYVNGLRQIDNELSKFVLNLITERYRYDYKRGKNVLNATNRRG